MQKLPNREFSCDESSSEDNEGSSSVDRPCKLQAVATVAIARIHQLCISLCCTFYTSLSNVFEHALYYIVTS